MTEPLDPKQRARGDGGWWVWFTSLFSSGDSSPHPRSGDGGIETPHHDSAHSDDSGADAGSDGGGGDGGGGGD